MVSGKRQWPFRNVQLIMIVLAVFASVAIGYYVYLPIADARRIAQDRLADEQQIRRLGEALLRYGAENGGKMPEAHWLNAVPITKGDSKPVCASRNCVIAMNSGLLGRLVDRVENPEETILLIQTDKLRVTDECSVDKARWRAPLGSSVVLFYTVSGSIGHLIVSDNEAFTPESERRFVAKWE